MRNNAAQAGCTAARRQRGLRRGRLESDGGKLPRIPEADDADDSSRFTIGARPRGGGRGAPGCPRAVPAGGVRSRDRCDAAGARARRLADVAPHPRRLGLQPARRDRPGQRRRPASGLVAGPPPGRPPAGHAAGVRRRPLHAEPERRHPGHRRRDGGPPLGAPPGPPRRCVRAHHARRLHDEPEPGHLREPDHRHQRGRVRLRPECADGELVWETRVLDYQVHPANQSTGPIIANGKVISGRSCMPAAGPEACVITAHDARTGEELWRRRTTPAPGEPGDETWGAYPINNAGTSARGWPRASTPS